MDRRAFLTTTALGAVAAAIDVGAQTPPTKPLDVLSKPTISPASKKIIDEWIVLIRKGGLQAGPNPDPDYSEFWVEMHPVDPSPDPSPDPPKPDDRRLMPGQLIRNDPMAISLRSKTTTQTTIDLRNYLARVAAKGDLAASGWPEEVWTEITPDWSEMYPEPQAKRPNAVITVSAKRRGFLLPKSYFSDLLRTVAATTK